MHILGICEDQKETVNYKYTYIDSSKYTSAASLACLENQIEQHVGDNIDHDLITIDGKSGFHAMGMIKITTPANLNHIAIDENRKLQRKTISKTAILSNMEGCEQFVPAKKNALQNAALIPYAQLLNKIPVKSLPQNDTVHDWYKGWIEGRTLHPNLMGFMHRKFNGVSLKSSIQFPRIINANPNEMQTIYITLIRAIKGTHEVPAIVTFDLPLFIKAQQIVKEQSLDVLLRLGGFHFLKSYLGCIGYIMEGSGLAEAMSVVYGSNTVTHILKGAAYSKVLRAHFLADGALIKHAMSQACTVDADIVQTMKNLAELSRTANLWGLYYNLIHTVQDYLLAERLHDWHGHLNAVSRMIGVFASADHSQYAKFGRLFLQEMTDLPQKYPKVT